MTQKTRPGQTLMAPSAELDPAAAGIIESRRAGLTRSAIRPRPRGPWQVAWILLIPLALWLGLAKTSLVLNAIDAIPEDATGVLARLGWLWWFTSVRFLMSGLLAWVIQRALLPQRRWTLLPLFGLLLVGFALAFPMTPPDDTLALTIKVWGITAFGQVKGLAACLWRDVVSIAMAVFVFGCVLWVVPVRAQRVTVLLLQAVVVLLCVLVGIDWVYQFATGQPSSSRVLLFAFLNMSDVAPLLAPEVSGPRIAAIAGGALLAAGWAWWRNDLAVAPIGLDGRAWLAGAVAALLALAILLPPPDHGVLVLLRHTEGTLITLAKTAAPTPMNAVQEKVAKDFEHNGRPPWYSAGMVAKETSRTSRKNVVIVMLESMRAESTTIHTPSLPTTPFLARLAGQSLMVEDMSAVIPRTAAAWMAVLGGQYPLANEGTAAWAQENRKTPRIRTLPSMLRDAGYATSFFTPTDLHFQSDLDVIDTFHFEATRTEQELTHPGDERVTYFGIADQLMVQPILDWTATQVQARRPFFTAIMTNVGHHNFETPSTWQRIPFEGVTNPNLENYYNCLRYIDGVMANLMAGYRQLGVLDDTIFIFLGDHGQMFDEHGARQIHNAVYQEGLRIPTLIYAPGLLQPGRVGGPRQQIDILPTVMELLGFRVEGARLPGQSLLHAVDSDRKLYFTSSIDWSFLAARRGSRKYIYSFDRDPMEVYDLARDPKELNALQDVDPKEIASAREDMLEWRMGAELAMLARPARAADPAGAWLKR